MVEAPQPSVGPGVLLVHRREQNWMISSIGSSGRPSQKNETSAQEMCRLHGQEWCSGVKCTFMSGLSNHHNPARRSTRSTRAYPRIQVRLTSSLQNGRFDPAYWHNRSNLACCYSVENPLVYSKLEWILVMQATLSQSKPAHQMRSSTWRLPRNHGPK